MKLDGKTYDVEKDEALNILGISKATLGRWMKENRVSYEYTKGKTRPKPLFDRDELDRLAGIEKGEIEDDSSLEMLDKNLEQSLIRHAGSNLENKSSQDNLKKNSNDEFSEMIKKTLLLPHKIYLTLSEASELTGFPQSQLKQFSELKFGRRVIKKSKLEKI